MIASVYIKDGNIHIYNENRQFTDLGGIAFELGRTLLDFVCYEHDRFDDSFSLYASALDNPFAYQIIKEPEFFDEIKRSMLEMQQRELYIYFYMQMYLEFIYTFVESPRQAIEQLAKKLPGVTEKLSWTKDFKWPASSSPLIQVQYFDNEKRLFRAAKDVIELLATHFRKFQKFIIHEVEVLLHYRENIRIPVSKSIDYIDVLDEYHDIKGYDSYYLEKPFRTFYGRVHTKEVEQLYEIESIEDLFRFEFIKMIEHDVFIKKCKNCEWFFIPRRRVDAEYCERIFGETGRKCSEIGAMLRYEQKVAENPVWEAYKKAYRRLHSRTRTGKMTNSEFMLWSDEATKKRDTCLAGEMAFEDFVAWLEQGRLRRARGGGDKQ